MKKLTLITTLQAHDRHTRGHAERVRVYTDMLTAELGLEQEDRERIRWAALLHDIGKLGVPDQVLLRAEVDVEGVHRIQDLRCARVLPVDLVDTPGVAARHNEVAVGGLADDLRGQDVAPNLVLNGGFELPGLPANQNVLYLTNGSTYITGERFQEVPIERRRSIVRENGVAVAREHERERLLAGAQERIVGRDVRGDPPQVDVDARRLVARLVDEAGDARRQP